MGKALAGKTARALFGARLARLLFRLPGAVGKALGLRPAVVKGTKEISPLRINHDLDTIGLLEGVTTFNFHPHLPHYALTTDDPKAVHVLSQQPIDLDRPHPFTAAGNTTLNSCLWLPPTGKRAGDIVMSDSTIFTTLFGGTESLENYWRNIARMRG